MEMSARFYTQGEFECFVELLEADGAWIIETFQDWDFDECFEGDSVPCYVVVWEE